MKFSGADCLQDVTGNLRRVAEQTHEYNEVVRMVFRESTSRMVFVNIFQRKVVSTTLFYFESLQAFAISI